LRELQKLKALDQENVLAAAKMESGHDDESVVREATKTAQDDESVVKETKVTAQDDESVVRETKVTAQDDNVERKARILHGAYDAAAKTAKHDPDDVPEMQLQTVTHLVFVAERLQKAKNVPDVGPLPEKKVADLVEFVAKMAKPDHVELAEKMAKRGHVEFAKKMAKRGHVEFAEKMAKRGHVEFAMKMARRNRGYVAAERARRESSPAAEPEARAMKPGHGA
jgi:hypothetical protein